MEFVWNGFHSMECTHLLDNVKVDNFNVEDTTITKNFNCSVCALKDQNWLCLQCGVINCGRYANGHAKLHAEALDHQVCMSCEKYTVHCYKCESYVSNDLDYNPIDKIRQSIKQLQRQHDVERNGNLEPSDDNSKDGSEGGNSMGSTSVSDKSASSSRSGDDSWPAEVISTISFGDGPNITPETSESKPSKSIKKITRLDEDEDHPKSIYLPFQQETVRLGSPTTLFEETKSSTAEKCGGKCSACALHSDGLVEPMDPRNKHFGELIAQELQHVKPCMRTYAYSHILKIVHQLKLKHTEMLKE